MLAMTLLQPSRFACQPTCASGTGVGRGEIGFRLRSGVLSRQSRPRTESVLPRCGEPAPPNRDRIGPHRRAHANVPRGSVNDAASGRRGRAVPDPSNKARRRWLTLSRPCQAVGPARIEHDAALGVGFRAGFFGQSSRRFQGVRMRPMIYNAASNRAGKSTGDFAIAKAIPSSAFGSLPAEQLGLFSRPSRGLARRPAAPVSRGANPSRAHLCRPENLSGFWRSFQFLSAHSGIYPRILGPVPHFVLLQSFNDIKISLYRLLLDGAMDLIPAEFRPS